MKSAIKEKMLVWCNEEKKYFSGNEWLAPTGDKEFIVKNPADQTHVTRFQLCSENDVDKSVEKARAAFKNKVFLNLNMRQRANMLRALGQVIRDHATELAALETLCNGKLYIKEALYDDMPDSADVFDYYAGWIDKHYAEVVPTNSHLFNYTLNEPYGVCALIVPWNYPLLLACWKFSCSLATGNAVIIKPSEYTSLSLLYFFEKVAEKKILPDGLVHVILGDGTLGDYLIHHAGIDKVSFTGSTTTGRKVVRASADSNLKSVSLELGGKSPNIIFADAKNLDKVINRAFTAMFSHKAEKCTGPTRLIVEESIRDRVIERLKHLSEKQICGDPFDENSMQGPQCYEEHFNRVMQYIQSGVKEGATLIAGGKRDTNAGNEKGFYIRPTIFSDVNEKMKIVKEEIFGPVLTLQSFANGNEEEALHLANDTTYGLAAGFYTQDMSRAQRFSKALEAGMIFINRYGMYEFSSPFGGVKQSGWGHEMGIHSLKEFTHCKSIWYNFDD